MRESDKAATPGPAVAGDVQLLARRARKRRRLASLGTAVGVVAVTAAVAVSSGLFADERQASLPAGVTASSRQPPISAESAAYAEAIRSLAGEVMVEGLKPAVVFILDHTCANVADPAVGGCDPRPMPETLRADLTKTLADYAQVRFIADGAEVTEPDLEVVDGGVVVTLGRLQIDGERALVPLSVRSGGRNGRGLTYKLDKRDGVWRVAGTEGSSWIS